MILISKQDEIREILIEERRNRGLTRKAFAALIGVTDRIVQYWETGERSPGRVDLIDSILKKLGRTVTLGE